MYKFTLKSIIVIMILTLVLPATAATPLKIVKNNNLTSTMPKVVKNEKFKSGHTLEVVKLEDGSMARRIMMQNQEMLSISPSTPHYEAEATTFEAPFVETFEGYDGESLDWIPEGWQDISRTDPPHVPPTEWALNFTWQVEGRGFDQALEGYYSARVQNSFFSDPENPGELVFEHQDEWLITPTIAISENNLLYFYLGYHPGWTLLNYGALKAGEGLMFNKVNNIMEVHISEDEGENWVKVWDCLDDAYTYSNSELIADLQSLTVTWVPFRLDLSEYQGKKIKVAFRYVGSEGESMRIDAVSIKQPEPQAFYLNPSGSFYNGFSKDFLNPAARNLLYGAYADCTWFNFSNMDSEQYEWSYTTDSEEVKTSTDVDLAYYCKPGKYGIPTLTASARYGESHSYKYDAEYLQLGGNNTINGVEYSACNYDIANSIGAYDLDGIYIFGNNNDDLWTSWFAQNADQEVELTSIGNYFAAPNHSYYFTKVWVNAIIDANTDSELTLEVLNITNGAISLTPIATSTCKLSEITQTTVDGNKYATIMFDFGRPITIEGEMMLKLSGFNNNPAIKEFAPLNQYYPNTYGQNYAYGFLTVTEGEESSTTLLPASSISTTLGILNTAFCFNLDATFTWLESNNTDIYASHEQTSKGLKFTTEYKTEDFTIEGEGVGEWITYNLGAYDEETNTQLITFTIAENFEDARSSDVYVRIPGSVKIVKVTQDKHPDYNGINGVYISGEYARVEGDKLIVNNPTGETINVYNTQGTLVYSQTTTEKEIIIDMTDHSKGIYFVRFGNGKTIKVIK